jgi:hypothetical protein
VWLINLSAVSPNMPDLPIMSDELFIAFDEDCLNVNFLKQMVNMSCEYVSILKFKLFLFRLPD